MIIYTDGACSGNPGPMGIGAVFYKGENRVCEISEKIGDGTNNIAEYRAVIEAVRKAREMGETDFVIRSDSQLLVRQLNGEYRIREMHLRKLKRELDEIMGDSMHVQFEHIPRDDNTEADRLSKKAIGL
ncbi:ribonuclease HI family protein [Candidatus Micrarchaeota archaeon]|nr:ribonuclease HI family protein [Candidatus Micrarchaeota archaeon]